MSRALTFVVTVVVALAGALPAMATTGGPNSFEVLGVDVHAQEVLLHESIGGESGLHRVWRIPYGKKGPAQVSAEIPEHELAASLPARESLTPAQALPLNALTLSGRIRRQSLEPHQEFLLPRYDLSVQVRFPQKGAEDAIGRLPLVGYRTPEVRLVAAHALPESRCALALVGSMGKPEETGYELVRPLVLCPGFYVAPPLPVPVPSPSPSP